MLNRSKSDYQISYMTKKESAEIELRPLSEQLHQIEEFLSRFLFKDISQESECSSSSHTAPIIETNERRQQQSPEIRCSSSTNCVSSHSCSQCFSIKECDCYQSENLIYYLNSLLIRLQYNRQNRCKEEQALREKQIETIISLQQELDCLEQDITQVSSVTEVQQAHYTSRLQVLARYSVEHFKSMQIISNLEKDTTEQSTEPVNIRLNLEAATRTLYEKHDLLLMEQSNLKEQLECSMRKIDELEKECKSITNQREILQSRIESLQDSLSQTLTFNNVISLEIDNNKKQYAQLWTLQSKSFLSNHESSPHKSLQINPNCISQHELQKEQEEDPVKRKQQNQYEIADLSSKNSEKQEQLLNTQLQTPVPPRHNKSHSKTKEDYSQEFDVSSGMQILTFEMSLKDEIGDEFNDNFSSASHFTTSHNNQEYIHNSNASQQPHQYFKSYRKQQFDYVQEFVNNEHSESEKFGDSIIINPKCSNEQKIHSRLRNSIDSNINSDGCDFHSCQESQVQNLDTNESISIAYVERKDSCEMNLQKEECFEAKNDGKLRKLCKEIVLRTYFPKLSIFSGKKQMKSPQNQS